VLPILVLSVAAIVLLILVFTIGLAQHSPTISGFSLTGRPLRNVHAVLMSFGAFLCFLSLTVPRKNRIIHISLNSVACVCIVLGGVCIYYFKKGLFPPDHLFATHEVVGFVVILLYFLQVKEYA
jgi:hypothetical protein